MTKSYLIFLKTKHPYLGLVRYALGIMMFAYSLNKILKTQFALPGFVWTEMQTLENIASKRLAWVFLGYSTWFQVLLGVLELLPALLVLFRRTTLLGAILMLPMTAGVVLINFALDLWDETKILSLMLIFLNLVILIFEWHKVKSIFLTTVGKALLPKIAVLELIFNLAVISIVSYICLPQLLEFKGQTNRLTGDWINQHPIEWILTKEVSNDVVLAPRALKVYFWADGMYTQLDDTNEVTPTTYNVIELKGKLALQYNDGKVVECNYSFPNETELKIELLKGHSKITQYFKKRIINENRN
nr:hypothetical protein [uncultured Pedobacter sp.]